MKHLHVLAIAAGTLALYATAIFLGLRFHPSAVYTIYPDAPTARTWHTDSLAALPSDQRSDVEFGARLFTETALYAPAYTNSRITCSNCHLGAGTAPFSAPVVASAQAFPQFSKRAGRKITLEDRVEECMTRSENGKPLPLDSPEMRAFLAYIRWLSLPHPAQLAYTGRGLRMLSPLTPNPAHGAELYAVQCAGCHGLHGEGARRPFPPLWGPEGFNDGAGMNSIEKMAAFVHTNMPQNRKGILSAQDSFDVAAFLHQQTRPAFNHANDRF